MLWLFIPGALFLLGLILASVFGGSAGAEEYRQEAAGMGCGIFIAISAVLIIALNAIGALDGIKGYLLDIAGVLSWILDLF